MLTTVLERMLEKCGKECLRSVWRSAGGNAWRSAGGNAWRSAGGNTVMLFVRILIRSHKRIHDYVGRV